MDFIFTHPAVQPIATPIEQLANDLLAVQLGAAPAPRHSEVPVIDDWALGHRFDPTLVGIVVGHPTLAESPLTRSGLYLLGQKPGDAESLSPFYVLGRLPLNGDAANGDNGRSAC